MSNKPRKIPMRMCIACNEMKPKKELIRVVHSKEGDISLDLTGKTAGRGAYICKSRECFALLKKGRRLNRAFSCNVSDDIYDNLSEQICKEIEENNE